MIDPSILNQAPKRFYCPYCEKWKDWNTLINSDILSELNYVAPAIHVCHKKNTPLAAIRFWTNNNSIEIMKELLSGNAEPLVTIIPFDSNDLVFDNETHTLKIAQDMIFLQVFFMFEFSNDNSDDTNSEIKNESKESNETPSKNRPRRIKRIHPLDL